MNDVNKITVLVVDDDPDICTLLEGVLGENGFVPIVTDSGDDLERITTEHKIDIVIMDLRLKGESGLTLARHLQQSRGIPVIMLSGVADEVEKIVGLELAVDDYVVKPFSPRELVARIRAVLRRTRGQQFAEPDTSAQIGENARRLGDYIVDFEQRLLLDNNGDEVRMTNTEFRLLEVLVTNPNTIFSRQELLDKLGADHNRYIDRTIDVFILRLRRKIERIPSRPVYLQTRRGKGYEIVLER